MPKASKATASDSMELDGYEGHFENLDGGYTVGFETYTADADLTPLFAGLPDDRCQCAALGLRHQGQAHLQDRRRRRDLRDRRRLLRRPRPHPDPVRRHRGRRVQPDQGAPRDARGRREEHGGRRRADLLGQRLPNGTITAKYV